ncbi:hypothetical protein HKCCE2091_11565 [Rhodobacterales bacterium HKCCE2091]|nr:hypothetical protein [Rhodobacterales bacterium HKCCE2091]
MEFLDHLARGLDIIDIALAIAELAGWIDTGGGPDMETVNSVAAAMEAHQAEVARDVRAGVYGPVTRGVAPVDLCIANGGRGLEVAPGFFNRAAGC